MSPIRFFWGAALLIPVLASPAAAHDLKVLASNFYPADKTTVYLSWGHALPVDDLIDGDSLLGYGMLDPKGKNTDLQISDHSLQANVVSLSEPGYYQVVAVKKPAILTYVNDAQGKRLLKRGPKSEATGGKIDYGFRSQQFAKAILVKSPIAIRPQPASPIIIKPLSLVKALPYDLEIVPLDYFEHWRKGKTLRFRVLFKGQKLSGEQLLGTYIGFRPTDAWCYATNTNREGIATVVPQQAGTWIFRVQVRKPAPKEMLEQYDYEHYTATLALEILP